MEKCYLEGNVFQQYGPPAHSAIYSKEYIMTEAILMMDWPAKSPEMKIVENVSKGSTLNQSINNFKPMISPISECKLFNLIYSSIQNHVLFDAAHFADIFIIYVDRLTRIRYLGHKLRSAQN